MPAALAACVVGAIKSKKLHLKRVFYFRASTS
jgi:hypothetical protein